ncbi:alpha/beta hydrolase [Rhodococcus sovatensis]|uniref:alpha/beta hydrolase n=1 Tax=Rhodococcus sovatensis TaxID=1805840 RepID=UPI003BAFB368
MGVLVSQLRSWTPQALVAVAADVGSINDDFDDRLSQMERSTDEALSDWEGDAAAAALARSLSDRIVGTHIVTAVAAVSETFGQAASKLVAVRDPALRIVDSAIAEGFTVEDSGTVIAPSSSTGDAMIDMLMQSSFDEKARIFQASLIPLLESAAEVDRACAVSLADAMSDLADITTASPAASLYSPEVRAILDGSAFLPEDPVALAEFWDQLSPAEKDGLAAWDPTIGNRDGLPAIDKSRYNEELLQTLSANADANVDDIEARHPDWLKGENLPPTQGIISDEDSDRQRELDRWLEERAAAEKTAFGYREVRTQLDKDGVPRYLMNIDAEGRGAIALNNPDSAGHVATYIPGTSSGLPSLGGDMDRAGNLLDAANSENGGRNSVVTWVGYNAPPEIHNAGSSEYAAAGAPRLDSFQDGLRAAHDGAPSVNTVIGHSYGSTVIGHAMSEGNSLDADRVIFVGSPGVGNGIDGVEDLRLDSVDPSSNHERIFATAAATDPVTWIGGAADTVAEAGSVIGLPGDISLIHGPDPTSSSFGATVFETDPGPSIDIGGMDFGVSPSTHSDYFLINNPGLEEMGRIIAGTR